jgi:hypothetical protein
MTKGAFSSNRSFQSISICRSELFAVTIVERLLRQRQSGQGLDVILEMSQQANHRRIRLPTQRPFLLRRLHPLQQSYLLHLLRENQVSNRLVQRLVNRVVDLVIYQVCSLQMGLHLPLAA